VQTSQGRLSIRHEKYRLDNGLEIILVEDHQLPLVAFNLWIHAGPRNEAAGQTGFAHLFEHLMFAGTKHIARGEADKLVDSVGGTDSNGSTDFDRTNYFFTLPSKELELGLWIKSDMLGFMSDQVDNIALANQQDVVRNERRQSRENRPYGATDEATYAALFPAGHPYRAMIMGTHADIQSIGLDDVKAFASSYYRPNNATLVLAGDFNPAHAKKLITKYFGALKAGTPVPQPSVTQPVLTAEQRVQVSDRVELSRLDIAWHTPAFYRAGDAELDVAANILGGGKASRLYKKLVYERQIAQSVTAQQASASLGSVFGIEALARANQSLQDIEALIDAELATLASTPPSNEEVQRALAQIETGLLARLETVSTLADTINNYNQHAGDPDFAGKDLARYRAVTPEAVRAAVAAYLRKNARVVVQTSPGEQQLAAEVATPPMPTEVIKGEALNADEPWRASRPGSGKSTPLKLPEGKRFTLANGLTVVHVPKPGLPLVSAVLALRAGQLANPLSQPGLASFTAAMLQEGTATRSSQQIADEAANLGTQLRTGSGIEDAYISVNGLKANFAKSLALVADVVRNPAFSADEVERLKRSRLGALAEQRANASAIAAVISKQSLFGDAHPLGTNVLGHEDSINATDRAALLQFWQSHYRPDQAALVVAGDVTGPELRKLAQALFGSWKKPANAVLAARAAVPRTTVARVVLVDKPGAPQTALAVVGMGPTADHRMSASINVMNAGLGGLFTSRINQQLREVKGYTYGVNSFFARGREFGYFALTGSVRTDATAAALSDVFKEIEGLRERPMPAEELMRVRNAQLLALPGLYDTNGAVAISYATDWMRGLPARSITQWPAKLSAVTAGSAQKAAEKYVDPKGLIVVAVGDKAKILPQLAAWDQKPLEIRDAAGKLLTP
jgi:zinc protease